MNSSPSIDSPRRESIDSRQLSLTSRFTLLVVPLAVVAILAGLFLIWNLLSGDDSPGFGVTDVLAIAIGVVVAAVVLATVLMVQRTARSAARDIEKVSAAANKVSHRDLVELLDTLRSPDADLSSITPLDLGIDRDDEIGHLGETLENLHLSLIDVAYRQMEALRQGVSSIFVTLARRNSSLVDRQLALLDEFEDREEDQQTLAGYYQLDHLATRMRRNAESLLVLAGSESPRVWAKATDMADVVRAAVSEVDEYQRIEVLALEPAKLSGGAVSDVSHLLAELLENALQFSPPSEAVRVTGLFVAGGYQLSVSDRGVGISDARVGEINRILDNPPALGLSVEPTLGMYVVAKLAHRHGVDVELLRGVPGITARLTVPRDHLEVVEAPMPRHWELPGEDERSPRGPEDHELTDAATREYVFKRLKDDEPQPVPVASTSQAAEVIDLTSPSMTEPGELPVRTPGGSFREDADSPSVGPGEGAVGLKSALSAFERGRRAAEEAGDSEDRS